MVVQACDSSYEVGLSGSLSDSAKAKGLRPYLKNN
jgi:hypothetical protein